MLSVGDAAAEAGDGFGLIGEAGNGLDEARELEDFADVSHRIEELEAAALALEGDEGADKRADAGAVHLGDAGEVDEDVAGRGLGELAQFGAECVVAGADDDAALQINDGDVSGFPGRDLQPHVGLLLMKMAR